MILDIIWDFRPFFNQFFSSIFTVLGQYIFLLRSIRLLTVGGYDITALDLRLGVLFLQIVFGIVFVTSPRMGNGSIFNGNGI